MPTFSPALAGSTHSSNSAVTCCEPAHPLPEGRRGCERQKLPDQDALPLLATHTCPSAAAKSCLAWHQLCPLRPAPLPAGG